MYKVIICNIDCNCKILETKCTLRHQRVPECIHTVEYYAAVKKNEEHFFELIWSGFQCGERKTASMVCKF